MEELPLNYRRAEAAMRSPQQVYRDPMRERWHKFMSDPTLDCVPKQSARKSGDRTVRCICGCGESFPSEVRDGS